MGIVAKYKYDGSVYADLIPEFNTEFTNYTVTDEIDSENSNHIIRTIESDSLPTLMRFGVTPEDSGNGTEREKSLMEIIELDTSNLTNASSMFRTCSNLSILHDINTWNVSNVINMASMFGGGCGITSLDLSNWDTPKVITFDSMFSNDRLLTTLKLFKIHSSCVNMYNMFLNCENIIALDLSSWDTESIEYYNAIFKGMFKLSSLDISNFSIKSTANVSDMFTSTLSLTDIGMIYCNQSTINKVASLLPTDHNITIWVESDDILQYDQYDHITYKTQKVQDTVHLNSPLLVGDTIEVIDGKTYHVHRYYKFVFDGSLNIDNLSNCVDGVNKYYNFVIPIVDTIYPKPTGNNQISDKLLIGNPYMDKNTFWILAQGANMEFRLNIENLKTVDEYSQYLQANPVTVVYELATPRYELISEEPLELTLLDTTDNTINNNSILPSNMTIANKELSTIAIKPSTTYTLSFDKSNEDSEVTIDICGGEQVTTVLNRVELTTPSELGSGIRFISSDGCIVSNVRLLEGSLVESAIPKETFEGLKNSFEDGYIIGENLVDVSNLPFIINSNGSTGTVATIRKIYVNTSYTFLPSTTYTFIIDVDTKNNERIIVGTDNGSGYGVNKLITDSSIFSLTTNNVVGNLWLYYDGYVTGEATINNIIVLEGDHTHLSEAELMRYIEKGTSHYEEEDYNHVGKYKVQYKVTGKNKFDKNKELHAINSRFRRVDYVVDFNDDYIRVKCGGYDDAYYLGSIGSFKRGTYTISCECYLGTSETPRIIIGYLVNSNWKREQNYQINFNTWGKFTYTFTLENDVDSLYLQFQAVGSSVNYDNLDFRVRNIQLEEGTVATEYEPYKEDIKTYYLSSPLLEGDTIEDINGVATHVKRYEKVVLDGSEQWEMFADIGKFYSRCIDNYAKDTSISISDKFADRLSIGDTIKIGGGLAKLGIHKLDKTTVSDFKQWLSQNPTTVVYELASPIYEPISTESILCDSYVNGHLDFDTHIPAEKVVFNPTTLLYKYLQPNTRYIIQFESDNIGKLDNIRVGTWTPQIGITNINKGINKLTFISPQTIEYHYIDIRGIGFNASNIQVVETNEDIEFDYFKGLQSSFEDGLITDENDENYGKYKVECKIVGKNKVNSIVYDMKHSTNRYICSKDYSSIHGVIPLPIGTYKLSLERYDVNKFIDAGIYIWRKGDTSGTARKVKMNQSFDIRDGDLGFTWYGGVDVGVSISDIVGTGIQIEEGTQATPYEPYKESIHTLYLNSPLLKGDKLVVHDGKLCHYHKMGMVVLDGSEDWKNFAVESDGKARMILTLNNGILLKLCDRLQVLDWNNSWTTTKDGISSYVTNNTELNILPYISAENSNGFKQWFQQNPTTVVYELAEPYYEPIEPQLSQYSFSTVKDGDMEIITVLPIEKINLTYRTDINGVSSIEEQIASIQEGTDISSIIDEEVDE